MPLVNNCALVKLQSDAHEYNKEHANLAILVVHSFICVLYFCFVFHTSKKMQPHCLCQLVASISLEKFQMGL